MVAIRMRFMGVPSRACFAGRKRGRNYRRQRGLTALQKIELLGFSGSSDYASMKTPIDPALRSIRKHIVLTELVLIGFAVIAFVFGVMIGLPQDRDTPHRGYTVTIEQVESTAAVEPAGS